MTNTYCTQCGHRNAPDAHFCSSCGGILEPGGEHTVTLARVDPLQDAPGTADDIIVDLDSIHSATLIVRNGPQAGVSFALAEGVTRLGRHPESEISLDDITVSRRHAEVIDTPAGYIVRDLESLNGTYVNQERIDEAPLVQGDELQVGKFRLVFFDRGEG